MAAVSLDKNNIKARTKWHFALRPIAIMGKSIYPPLVSGRSPFSLKLYLFIYRPVSVPKFVFRHPLPNNCRICVCTHTCTCIHPKDQISHNKGLNKESRPMACLFTYNGPYVRITHTNRFVLKSLTSLKMSDLRELGHIHPFSLI